MTGRLPSSSGSFTPPGAGRGESQGFAAGFTLAQQNKIKNWCYTFRELDDPATFAKFLGYLYENKREEQDQADVTGLCAKFVASLKNDPPPHTGAAALALDAAIAAARISMLMPEGPATNDRQSGGLKRARPDWGAANQSGAKLSRLQPPVGANGATGATDMVILETLSHEQKGQLDALGGGADLRFLATTARCVDSSQPPPDNHSEAGDPALDDFRNDIVAQAWREFTRSEAPRANLALLEAIQAGKVEVVLPLLEFGADPSTVSMQPARSKAEIADIQDAAEEFLAGPLATSPTPALDFVATLQSLAFAHGAAGRNALTLAVMNGQPDMVAILCQWMKRSNPDIIDRADGSGDTPLTTAVENGQRVCATVLFAYGAKVEGPNARGWTPLCCAAHKSDREMTQLLLQHGAHVLSRGSKDLPLGLAVRDRTSTNEIANDVVLSALAAAVDAEISDFCAEAAREAGEVGAGRLTREGASCLKTFGQARADFELCAATPRLAVSQHAVDWSRACQTVLGQAFTTIENVLASCKQAGIHMQNPDAPARWIPTEAQRKRLEALNLQELAEAWTLLFFFDHALPTEVMRRTDDFKHLWLMIVSAQFGTRSADWRATYLAASLRAAVEGGNIFDLNAALDLMLRFPHVGRFQDSARSLLRRAPAAFRECVEALKSTENPEPLRKIINLIERLFALQSKAPGLKEEIKACVQAIWSEAWRSLDDETWSNLVSTSSLHCNGHDLADHILLNEAALQVFQELFNTFQRKEGAQAVRALSRAARVYNLINDNKPDLALCFCEASPEKRQLTLLACELPIVALILADAKFYAARNDRDVELSETLRTEWRQLNGLRKAPPPLEHVVAFEEAQAAAWPRASLRICEEILAAVRGPANPDQQAAVLSDLAKPYFKRPPLERQLGFVAAVSKLDFAVVQAFFNALNQDDKDMFMALIDDDSNLGRHILAEKGYEIVNSLDLADLFDGEYDRDDNSLSDDA